MMGRMGRGLLAGCGFAISLAAGGGAAIAGPSEKEVAACMASAPAGLEPYWQPLCAAEPKDVVLHRMRAGQMAFARGHGQQAEEQFDAALAAIDSVYAESETAQKARSLWHAEGVKDFKGEPYERVMAQYYRGLLDLIAADFDNAQASFKGAVLQDSFAFLERHRADVASMVWLAGWATRCRGGDAAELFAEAAALRPALKPPAPEATVLVVAETGTGPRKSTTGMHNEKLVFGEGMRGNDRLVAALGGHRQDMVEAEDLFFQATSRGGRQMDELLAEKGRTKDSTQAFGQAAMAAGMSTMAVAQSQQNNNGRGGGGAVGAVGGAIALVGMIAYASAQSMNPQADTRTWDTLPHSIHLAALAMPSASLRTEAVDLLDGDGASVLPDRSRLRVATHEACSLIWVGAESILPSRSRPAAAAVSEPAGPATCRTPSGAAAALPADVCARIGGTPLP